MSIIVADFIGKLYLGKEEIGRVSVQKDIVFVSRYPDINRDGNYSLGLAAWRLEFEGDRLQVSQLFKQRGFRVLALEEGQIILQKPVL